MKFTWSSRNYTLKLVNIQGNAAVFNVTPGNILVSSNIPDKGYPFDVTGDSKEDVYIDVLRMPSSTLVTFELGKYVAPRLNETQGNQTIGGEGGEVVIKGTYKTILYFIIGLIILVALGIFVYMGIRWRASKKTIALVKEKQKEQQEYASLQKYNDYMKSLDIKDGDTKGS